MPGFDQEDNNDFIEGYISLFPSVKCRATDTNITLDYSGCNPPEIKTLAFECLNSVLSKLKIKFNVSNDSGDIIQNVSILAEDFWRPSKLAGVTLTNSATENSNITDENAAQADASMENNVLSKLFQELAYLNFFNQQIHKALGESLIIRFEVFNIETTLKERMTLALSKLDEGNNNNESLLTSALLLYSDMLKQQSVGATTSTLAVTRFLSSQPKKVAEAQKSANNVATTNDNKCCRIL